MSDEKRERNSRRIKSMVCAVAAMAVLAAYFLIFAPFFPGTNGMLGHDYSLKFPQLLDGYLWYKKNGLFSVYWFSPSFCGGVPVFPNPINQYCSVIQLFTFYFGPLGAVITAFLLFGALGFWGFYIFARTCLSCSRPVAFLCGTLFLFNGFYWSKFLVGALDYHSFMLIPWCAWLLLADDSLQLNKACYVLMRIGRFFAIGALFSYFVYSGLQTLIPATILSIVLLCAIAAIAFPGRFKARTVVVRFFSGTVAALGISAAKLSAVFHLMQNFPRINYPLPQFTNLADLLQVVVSSLWGSPLWELAGRVITNRAFVLGRHEFEFCVGPVPFWVCACFVPMLIKRVRKGEQKSEANTYFPRRFALFSLVFFILALPVALNLYAPWWNGFLKRVPLIASSTQCVRWFCIYIPALVVLTGLVFEWFFINRRLRAVVAVCAVLVTVVWNMKIDRTYYFLQQSYSCRRVQQAYWAVRKGAFDPRVTHISVSADRCNRVITPPNRDDAFIYNHSQQLCYDSIFGYNLENLPFGDLHPGPVDEVTNGHFNMKNPACYVFPAENGCKPGDHFASGQRDALFAFAGYRPFPFHVSVIQKAANYLTLLFLPLAVVFLLLYLCMVVWRALAKGIPFCEDSSNMG